MFVYYEVQVQLFERSTGFNKNIYIPQRIQYKHFRYFYTVYVPREV